MSQIKVESGGWAVNSMQHPILKRSPTSPHRMKTSRERENKGQDTEEGKRRGGTGCRTL